MKRILVAGIGNIFQGDDAFGVEVAQRLARQALPEGVTVTDFGIRSYDLALALADNYDAVILVDALTRAQTPGTVFLVELDPVKAMEGSGSSVNGHSLDPVHALQLAGIFGGCSARIYLVGCEPAVLDADEFGLSREVEAAVPVAIHLIESVINELPANPAHELAL